MALTKVKAGNILLTTPGASSNDVTPATTAYVTTALANLADSAPSTLDTLNELAAALGDDANFSTTVTNSIAAKLPLAGGTLTGAVVLGTASAQGNQTSPALRFGPSTYRLGMYTTSEGAFIENKNGDDGINFLVKTAGQAMRIDGGTGNVGIGTTSPAAKLSFSDHVPTNGQTLHLYHAGNVRYGFGIVDGAIRTYANSNGGSISFGHVSNIDGSTYSERMKIDSSGNVGIGTTADIATSSSSSSTGFWLSSSDYLAVARNQQRAAIFNRIGNDGEVVAIRKDGTTVGSIGTEGGDIVIGTGDTAVQFADSLDCIRPFTSSGSGNGGRDNAIDLGRSGQRFKDLYLSGGVYLGGTGAANQLDDYEEGTWTPGVYSGTVTAQTATYTKIGRIVHVVTRLSSFSENAAAQIQITNLPYTIASGNTNIGSGWGNFSEQNVHFYAAAAVTSTIAYYGGSNYLTATYASLGGTGANILIKLTYETN